MAISEASNIKFSKKHLSISSEKNTLALTWIPTQG